MPTGFLGDTSIRLSTSTESFYGVVENYNDNPDEPLYLYSYLSGPGVQICRGLNPRVVGTTDSLTEFMISNGSTITCTNDQRFLTSSYEFIQAIDLSCGTNLLGIYFNNMDINSESVSGTMTRIINFNVIDIKSVTLDEPVGVYNMDVNLCYDYVVVNNNDPTTGILAHDN